MYRNIMEARIVVTDIIQMMGIANVSWLLVSYYQRFVMMGGGGGGVPSCSRPGKKVIAGS